MKEHYGGIDVLVNNAAIAFKNSATEPFALQVGPADTSAITVNSVIEQRLCLSCNLNPSWNFIFIGLYIMGKQIRSLRQSKRVNICPVTQSELVAILNLENYFFQITGWSKYLFGSLIGLLQRLLRPQPLVTIKVVA